MQLNIIITQNTVLNLYESSLETGKRPILSFLSPEEKLMMKFLE